MVVAFAIAAVAVGVWIWRRGGGEPPAGVPTCETGPTVPGLDVSYYQEDITWTRVRKAGLRYAFIRATDGTTITDARFTKNWAGAKRAGLLRGAYQYFRPDQNALAQADLLINMIARDPGELPPVIDVETDGGKSPAVLEASVRVWVDRVRERLGVEPIVYTGPEFWASKLRGADLTSQPLWLAHYTRTCPTVPSPWRRWTFWQHTDNGRVPGIEGPVDLDVFAGTFAELQALGQRRVVKPTASR